METGFVICCNDAVAGVVLEDEKLAEQKCKELAKQAKDKWSLSCGSVPYRYEDVYYWHLHEVPVYKCK